MFKSVTSFTILRGMEAAKLTGTPGGDAPQEGRVARRKAETRARILGAARSLFARQGVEQTTIREIAGAADIALGGFYNYFRTKDDVLAALLEATLAEQDVVMEQRQRSVADVAERMSIGHRHLLAMAREDPEWGRLLVRLDAEHQLLSRVLGERASRDLEEGVAGGRFAVAGTRLALRAMGGALMGVIQGNLAGELGPQDDSAHAEGVLRALGIPPAEAAEIARRPLPGA